MILHTDVHASAYEYTTYWHLQVLIAWLVIINVMGRVKENNSVIPVNNIAYD